MAGHFLEIPAEVPAGAWAEKRRLAAALRELMALCVTTDAPLAALEQAANSAEALAAALGPHPRRTFRQGFGPGGVDMAALADRSAVVGRSNPMAPPIVMTSEGERSIGRVNYGPSYEGAPGFVHGGFVAAAFDQLFGHLEVARGALSLTGTLTVHYRIPTPLLQDLVFEAWVARVDGKRNHLAGRVRSGEQVTAEAEAIFIAIDPARLIAMFEGRA